MEALRDYRRVLEFGWSRRTIHPDHADEFRQGMPIGQCGVSSAWLAHRLGSRFDSMYCYGDLIFDDANIDPVMRHCWLEVASADSWNPIVIDLTADQAPGFSERIVAGNRSKLENAGMRYTARTKKPPHSLPFDAVWPRFIILSDAITAIDEAA